MIDEETNGTRKKRKESENAKEKGRSREETRVPAPTPEDLPKRHPRKVSLYLSIPREKKQYTRNGTRRRREVRSSCSKGARDSDGSNGR